MVTRSQIQDLADAMAKMPGVQSIILFGSHADATARADSDVDLLVISDAAGPTADERLRLRLAAPRSFPLDLVLRRPEQVQRQFREHNPIVREAIERGVVLYERRDTAVA